MEKRVIVFLILSLAIIFGYQYLMKELGLLPAEDPMVEGIVDRPTSSSPEGEAGSTAEGSRFSDLQGPAPAGAATAKESSGFSELEEVLETIETPLIQATVSNRGGHITSWKLKKYLTKKEEGESRPIELVYPEGHFLKPLSLQVADPELTKALNQGVFEVSRDFKELDASHPEGRLTFSYSIPEKNISVQKVLTFHYDRYVVDVAVTTQGLSEEDLSVLLGTNFGVVEWGQGFIGLLGPAWMIGDVLEKEVPETEIHRSGDIRWAALQDKYFISVIIPQQAHGVWAQKEADMVITAGVEFPAAQKIAFQLYAGPKQFDLLKAFQIGLEDTIDFGWFIYGSWGIVKAVAKPLFYVLRFLYDYTHNYGVAIILLTLGIKLLFVPLQYKSYTSMQGMQKIQPQVVALQNKYKDDKERLNKELIKLYRDHKVNPVGGCLPMFVQMPAFVSLFNILYMTVDLRQAPFMLWITDLSAQDPYYVLPVLMGVSMVVQQKIMPTTMDPTQAKMMLILPVFLTFLFVTFPAGLVLYWLTNNVLTITQQFVTDRFIHKKNPAPPIQSEPSPPSKGSPEKPVSEETGKKKKGKGKGTK